MLFRSQSAVRSREGAERSEAAAEKARLSAVSANASAVSAIDAEVFVRQNIESAKSSADIAKDAEREVRGIEQDIRMLAGNVYENNAKLEEKVDEVVAEFEGKTIYNLRSGKGKNSLEGIDIEEEPAQAIGLNCLALGNGSIAGCKGYYVQAIDFTNKQIYLSNRGTAFQATNEKGTIINIDVGYAVGDKFSIINDGHYTLKGTISAIDKNVITYREDSLGITSLSSSGTSFYVPSKPLIGIILIADFAMAIGDNVIAAGKGALGAGKDLLVAGRHGANIGRGNTTGYGSTALGTYNYVPAQTGAGIGDHNTVTGYYGMALGRFNEVKAVSASAIGESLKAYSKYQSVRGFNNIPDSDMKYVDIVGVGYGAPCNGYTLDWDGNARYKGKAYVECADGIGTGKELAAKSYVDNKVANASTQIGSKAEKDLSNVDNETFKQKAIDSGLIDYILSQIPSGEEVEY